LIATSLGVTAVAFAADRSAELAVPSCRRRRVIAAGRDARSRLHGSRVLLFFALIAELGRCARR